MLSAHKAPAVEDFRPCHLTGCSAALKPSLLFEGIGVAGLTGQRQWTPHARPHFAPHTYEDGWEGGPRGREHWVSQGSSHLKLNPRGQRFVLPMTQIVVE